MPQFRYVPPAAKLDRFTTQTVELLDGRIPIARAAWRAVVSVPGAYELVWAEVAETQRRRGNGSLVISEAVRQAQSHAKASGVAMRRMLLLIPQRNVIARAWLARNGFLHVNTLKDVGADGEVLVMIRTFT